MLVYICALLALIVLLDAYVDYRPLFHTVARVYRDGPWPVGWAGLDPDTICSQLTGTNYRSLSFGSCLDLIRQRENAAYIVTSFSVLGVAVCYVLFYMFLLDIRRLW